MTSQDSQLMDPRKKRELLSAIKTLLAHLEATPDKKSCGSCEHWRGDRCSLANAVPPSQVQAEGCESWVFDEVPF